MLTLMPDPALLLRQARYDTGLSMRALARLADVSYTTICRIEHGQVDPTVGTLRKLLAATGGALELSSRPEEIPRLADLADAWSKDHRGEDRPDWTRLRVFADYLRRHPEHSAIAVLGRPRPSGSALLDNILAGVAEKTADDAGFPQPPWTKLVEPLPRQWADFGTPRMRVRAERSTPRVFARRNLVLPTETIWRSRPTQAAS
jgi:transcriptional regulator with XRE-family HTH domain